MIVFWDESGASLLPVTRRTWAPRGHTPVISHHFKWKRCSMAVALCYGSLGGGAAVAFHYQHGAYDTDTLIQALGGLRAFLGGQKATLVWDGLPAHRSLAMRVWLRGQRSWLGTEPLPGYAPELNPVEGLWASLKGRGAGQPRWRHPRGGHRGGRAGHPAHPGDPLAGVCVPAPLWPVAVVSSDRVAGKGRTPCRVARSHGAARLARTWPASAESGNVCPVDDGFESLIVGVAVSPSDVAANHVRLLGM